MTVSMSLARSKGCGADLRRLRSSIEEVIFCIVRGRLKWENTPESISVAGATLIESTGVLRGAEEGERGWWDVREDPWSVLDARFVPSVRRDSRTEGDVEAGGTRDRRGPP